MPPRPDPIAELVALLDELYADPCALWTFLADQPALRGHLERFGALAPSPGERPVLLRLIGRTDDPRAGNINSDNDTRHAVDGAGPHLEIVPYPNATLADLTRKLGERLERRLPTHAVQLTAHGDRNGNIHLADGEPLGPERLAEIVTPSRLRLLVLGACHSATAAPKLEPPVPFAIGFRGESNDAAIPEFCETLYRYLAAASIPQAFATARAQVTALQPVLVIDRRALIKHLEAARVLDAPFFDTLERAHPNAAERIARTRDLWLRRTPTRSAADGTAPPRLRSELLALLDRTEAWTTLLAACAPGQSPHLFIITGPHDQDLPLFRDRIVRHIDDPRHRGGGPPRRAGCAYYNDPSSGRARTSEEWTARCVGVACQGTGSLDEALTAFAAAGPSFLLLDLTGEVDYLDAFLAFLSEDLLPALARANQVRGRGPLHLAVLAHEEPPPSGLGRLLARLAALFGRDRAAHAAHAKREALDRLRALARDAGLVTPALSPLRCPTWAEIEDQYPALTPAQRSACKAACEPLIRRHASLREVADALHRALYPRDPDAST